MNSKIRLIAVLFVCLWAFVSCSSSNEDSDKNGNTLPVAVETAFYAKYSGASDVKWTSDNGFWNVDFELVNVDYEAWFSPSGAWLQAEHTVDYSSLPVAVKESVGNNINYPPTLWTPDNSVEVLESLNTLTWYGMDMKNGALEATVWYDVEGNTVKVAVDDYSGNDIPSEISGFITKKYPQSVTLEVDKLTNGTFDARILDAKRVKTVLFNQSYEWNYTVWFVPVSEVPQVVMNVLAGEAFSGYSVKQVQYRQYATGNRYHFLLAKAGSLDLAVNVDTNGNIILN